MKKNLAKKLVLNKSTIINLDREAQEQVKGGGWASHFMCMNTGLQTACHSHSCDAIICMNIR